jgi:drug/metabolite transporter (DMT)-like permease
VAGAYVLLAMCSLFWSGNVLTARALHADVPPFALSFWRWTIAFVLIAPFAMPELVRRRGDILRAWRSLVPAGVLGMGAYSSLVYLGLQTTTATNTALVNATIPVMIGGLTAVVYGQRLAPLQWVGVVLSAAGVVTIVVQGDLRALAALRVNVGDLWVLVAVSGFVVYTVCVRRSANSLSALGYLAVMIGVASLSTLPFYLFEMAHGARVQLTHATLAGMAYVATLPSLFAYFFWNRGVDAVGPARAGVFLYLMPVFTTGLAITFLGERLLAYHLAGIVLIVAGIGLTTAAGSAVRA